MLKQITFLAILISPALSNNAGIFSETKRFDLPTSKIVSYAVSGAQVTFTDIPLGDDISELDLKCNIHSSGRINGTIVVEPVVTNDLKQVICRLPPRITSGRVQVDLEVQSWEPPATTESFSSSTEGYYSEIYTINAIITPNPATDLQLDENWDAKQVDITWDPAFFKGFFGSGALILLEATIHISDGGSATFIPSGFRQVVGNNELGTVKIDISAPNYERVANFRFPYFYVLNPVGKPDAYLASRLLTPTASITPEIAQEVCDNWLPNARGPPNLEEVTPCPNCLCKAKLDKDFYETQYDPQIVKLAEGRLANHKLFYQQNPSESGHAQSCSYNVATEALAQSSPAEAAWVNYLSKDISYVDNYLEDIWPYIACCLQSNSARHCESFHQRRPIDDGRNYPGADEPCQGTGDPHMITFDGVRYDFMGFGEFWLIKGPDPNFGVQGRMSPVNAGQTVSYYRAVAVRDGNTTIQMQHNAGAIQILVNQQTLLEMPATPTTIPLGDGDASISINGGTVEVRLKTGFTIKLTSATSYFNVYGHGAQKNKGKGFMGIFGNFDGNITNDLTSQDGLVIAPELNRNLSLIHNVFGLSWMTKPEESFFVYEEGLGWANYSNPDFGPTLEYPDPATMPEHVRAICKENLACYYEYVGSGENLDEAEETVVADEELEKLKEEVAEEILMCAQINSTLDNGRVMVEGYLNGSVVRYACDEEYELSDKASKSCMVTEGAAEWIGEEPTCIWTCGLCTEDVEYQLSLDPADCNKFFLCSYGVRHFLECPVGENFNPESEACDAHYECEGQPGCKSK